MKTNLQLKIRNQKY